jgi:hypothetical protein
MARQQEDHGCGSREGRQTQSSDERQFDLRNDRSDNAALAASVNEGRRPERRRATVGRGGRKK